MRGCIPHGKTQVHDERDIDDDNAEYIYFRNQADSKGGPSLGKTPMTRLDLRNPFNAPIYHEETVGSTMDASKALVRKGDPANAPHGTVICADFQEAGRGRVQGRVWNTGRRDGLMFTVLLRFQRIGDIPKALTLRTGLAVALAIEDFSPQLRDGVKIKWPNDVMLPAPDVCGEGAQGFRKAVGILAEAEGGDVYIGIGVNVAQREFPAGLRDKATSVAIASGAQIESGRRFELLQGILARLHDELETAGDAWRERIEARLYMKGARTNFAEGPADSTRVFVGTIAGIGPGGELLIVRDGETDVRAFVSGEVGIEGAYPTNH